MLILFKKKTKHVRSSIQINTMIKTHAERCNVIKTELDNLFYCKLQLMRYNRSVVIAFANFYCYFYRLPKMRN